MSWPSHPPWLDHIVMFGEEYKLWSSSLRSILQPPVTSSLFGPNILLSTLFSLVWNLQGSSGRSTKWTQSHPTNNYKKIKKNNLKSSLNVRGQVSHPYKTTGRIVLSFLFNFYVFRQQTRRLKVLNWAVRSLTRYTLLLTTQRIKFWFVSLVPKYVNSAAFSKNLLARVISSAIQRRVVRWMSTDVSKEHIACIFWIEEYADKKPPRKQMASWISIFISWFSPPVWWRDVNISLVFSAFTSRPTSLLKSIRVSVFFFMVKVKGKAIPVPGHGGP
jgi:hypothetical protein